MHVGQGIKKIDHVFSDRSWHKWGLAIDGGGHSCDKKFREDTPGSYLTKSHRL